MDQQRERDAVMNALQDIQQTQALLLNALEGLSSANGITSPSINESAASPKASDARGQDLAPAVTAITEASTGEAPLTQSPTSPSQRSGTGSRIILT
jgi:hypothetical protein